MRRRATKNASSPKNTKMIVLFAPRKKKCYSRVQSENMMTRCKNTLRKKKKKMQAQAAIATSASSRRKNTRKRLKSSDGYSQHRTPKHRRN